jgi:hypothetical protein
MSLRHFVLVFCLLVPVAARAQPAEGTGETPTETTEPTAAPEAAAAPEAPEITDSELGERPADQELAPSLPPEQLRQLARVAKAKVLERMEAKMTEKAARRMATIGRLIGWFSLAGLLLLLMPLVLRGRYPGKGKELMKYSALAAVTFVVTVNLFGVVVLGFRSAQAGLGSATNPQLHVVSGFFDSLDKNADDYAIVGKELFGPTLAQLQGDTDEQPVAILLENGKKLVKDADVFVTVAKAFKKLDVVFGILPTVLLLVTMVLFVLALRPTLMAIVRLPIDAAAGKAISGRQVVSGALRRIGGEVLATLCTLGVLVVLTLLAGAILGRVVGPALDALLGYFILAVMYLQYVKDASSALVFVMLFSVILFLVLNLAAVIASMTLFLGKAQKIFQRRFHEGVPVRAHARFWKWGIPALLVAQVVPWLYLVLAERGIEKLNDKMTNGITDAAQLPWGKIMLSGPLILVVGFVVMFWAARGWKALAFLARYKPNEA